MGSNCEKVLEIHLENSDKQFCGSDICIVTCRKYGVTIAEFKKYCTRMKREGKLKLEKDSNGNLVYKRVG